ncbi:BEACH domain-containing protein C2 [Vitis vinifera]|uniref:BEACH domain-containing protein C2 n=1 Tax=Vitis vinifera TaxID=29760 RepID=A0A438IWG9_VITVI|nr:BEACH domain-containing protein C2 [Vitis vinifera]
MQRSEIDRRTQVVVVSRHHLCSGIRAWRKLIHNLIEMKCLFGPFGDHLCNPDRVFWKLDFMESSARMRQCLRRNYKGSDHFGAAANFEDHMDMKHDRENVIDPSNAPILAAEAISMGGINEEDEQADIDNLVESEAIDMEQNEKNQPKSSGMAEQPLQASTEYIDTPIANKPRCGPRSSAVAPWICSK